MASENEKREMLADILAEWRECIKAADPSVWNDERIAELVKTTKAQQLAYLDRIEEAWKREREELDKRISDLEAYAKLWTGRADELRLKCDEFYAKAKPVGNAAALREALIAMVRAETDGDMTLDALCGRCLSKLHGTCKHDGSCWCEKVIAAISAPARNCDVGTAEEQGERCMAQFDQWRRKGDGRKLITAIMAWAQTPYEKQEGGEK